MLEEAQDQWVTATEATRILGVQADRVRNWVRRGHLTPAGHHDGRPMFVVAHVARLHRHALLGIKLAHIDTENAA